MEPDVESVDELDADGSGLGLDVPAASSVDVLPVPGWVVVAPVLDDVSVEPEVDRVLVAPVLELLLVVVSCPCAPCDCVLLVCAVNDGPAHSAMALSAAMILMRYLLILFFLVGVRSAARGASQRPEVASRTY